MRHRLRERPKPAATTNARRRGRKSRAALAEEGSLQAAISSDCEGALMSELDGLLTADEAAGWWRGEDERPEDASLADLLQHLVGSEDDDDDNIVKMEAAAIPIMAASHPTNKMAAANHPTDAPRPSPASTLKHRGPGNKNALAARLNRLRKKEYVSGLEGRVARLAGENQRLERERAMLGARVRELEAESRYLRAVLANDSALSQLLGRLTGAGGVKLSTSLFRSPPSPGDHDYALPGLEKTRDPDLEDDEEGGGAPSGGGGVCLHVDKDKVSVEFCPACARSASSSAKIFSSRCTVGLLHCRSLESAPYRLATCGFSCTGQKIRDPVLTHIPRFVVKGSMVHEESRGNDGAFTLPFYVMCEGGRAAGLCVIAALSVYYTDICI